MRLSKKINELGVKIPLVYKARSTYRRGGIRVKEVIVPDRHIWPTDYTATVKRYALVDRGGAVWINGRIFGLLTSMVKADRSSSDCRDLLRDTPEDAAKDQNHWYRTEKHDGKYVMVIDNP